MDHFYNRTFCTACAMDTSVTGTHEAFSNFLINLMLSRRAAIAGHKIHYLHLALIYLDSFEQEICASNVEDEILRLARIPDLIRSVKTGIQEYIGCLTALESEGAGISISSG